MREQIPSPGEDYLSPLRSEIQQIDNMLLENLNGIKAVSDLLGRVAWISYKYRNNLNQSNTPPNGGSLEAYESLLVFELARGCLECEAAIDQRLEYSRYVAIAKFQQAEHELAEKGSADGDAGLHPVEFEIRRTAQEERKIAQLQESAKKRNYTLSNEEIESAWHAIMDASCEEQLAFLRSFGFIDLVETDENYHVKIWKAEAQAESTIEDGIIPADN